MSLVPKRRNIFDLTTPLGEVPREWLQLIEPHITRDGDHWRWNGPTDAHGEPIVYLTNPATGRRNTKRVKRIVAEMFWELKSFHDVLHECGVLECVNPSHLEPTPTHWKQRGRQAIC